MALWPIGLIAIGIFAATIHSAPTARAAFARGWLFGVAHFTLANNWIATAFTYQAEMPAALGWLAVPLLSLVSRRLSGPCGMGCVVAHAAGRQARRCIASICCCAVAARWIVTEWLRSWVFTGYAWDPLGLILLGDFARPGLAAALPLTGTYALSGLAVLLAAGFGLR